MNKKFLKISFSIIIFTLAFSLLFKLLLGDKTTYGHSSQGLERVKIDYSGFEEDENNYRIKVNFQNDSSYYMSLSDVTLEFNTVLGKSVGNPSFHGIDIGMNNEENISGGEVSPYIDPNEVREYSFEISKGINFDKKVFDTNWMNVGYSANYYKYRLTIYSAMGNAGMISGSEHFNNATQPFKIE